MFIYQTNPIDFFDAAPTFKDFLRQMFKEAHLYKDEPPIGKCLITLMQCARAVSLAKGGYWEGDVNQLRVFSLPNPEHAQMEFGVVWKQGNNGTTFICSPLELPWLAGDLI